MFSYEKYSKIRDKKGLTDYAVAAGAGIAKQMISSWKNTDNVNPGVGHVAKVAEFLDVPIEALIENEHTS